MKTKNALEISFIVIVLVSLLVWGAEVFAQPPRFGAERGGMKGIGPQPSSTSAMAISPDSKYLYLFHANKIYQFKLPGLRLVNSVEVEIPERLEKHGGEKRDFIKDFDMNNDGRVSKEEFTGPSQLFERFDMNNDGYIDASEVPEGPSPQKRRR